jgi:hypothetical protein
MTIKFPDMVQINKKTKFMRRIRVSLELKNENGFFIYEWQNENKKWEAYTAEIMVKIADAINNDQMTLSVTCGNRSYDIDLKKLVQINTSTNVSRKIHCVKSSLSEDFVDILDQIFFLFSGEITIGCFYNIK